MRTLEETGALRRSRKQRLLIYLIIDNLNINLLLTCRRQAHKFSIVDLNSKCG